jgi:hypothetical protein
MTDEQKIEEVIAKLDGVLTRAERGKRRAALRGRFRTGNPKEDYRADRSSWRREQNEGSNPCTWEEYWQSVLQARKNAGLAAAAEPEDGR